MMDSQSVSGIVLYFDWIEWAKRVPREDYSQHSLVCLDEIRVQHPCLPCAVASASFFHPKV